VLQTAMCRGRWGQHISENAITKTIFAKAKTFSLFVYFLAGYSVFATPVYVAHFVFREMSGFESSELP
jgi:hypothetical protein